MWGQDTMRNFVAVLLIWKFCHGTGCHAASLFPPDFCNSVLTDVCSSPKRIQVQANDYNKTSEGVDYYPEWSWDRVRTYVNIRRCNKYSDSQIRALAAQDVVMLGGFNGWKTYGSTEKGTVEAAKRIKAVNPKVKILTYLNSMVHYKGYAANKYWKNEWAMKKRGRYYKWRKKFLCYDHTNLEFREWWIQRALGMLEHEEIDGIFIDGIVKTDKRYLPKKNHGKAYISTANELRERMPAGKILIGNSLRARTSNRSGYLNHLKYLDGSYLEGWASKDRLAPTLDLISAALKQGRIIMLNAHPFHVDKRKYNRLRLNGRYDYLDKPKHIGFPLGYFLLVAEPHAYFSFHVGVDAKPRRKTVFDNTRFEAIMRKLGKPMGNYVKLGKYEYYREFEHLEVRVNFQTWEGVLTVKVPSNQPSWQPSESLSVSNWPTSQPSESPSTKGHLSPEPSDVHRLTSMPSELSLSYDYRLDM